MSFIYEFEMIDYVNPDNIYVEEIEYDYELSEEEIERIALEMFLDNYSGEYSLKRVE